MDQALFDDLLSQNNYMMIFFIYYSDNNQKNEFVFDMNTFTNYFNLYITSLGMLPNLVIQKLLQHIKNNLK
jgi:hypothetical protein